MAGWQGTLPVVTEVPPVTVVTSESAASTGSNLGDLLMNKPGITGSSFAPGASAVRSSAVSTSIARHRADGIGAAAPFGPGRGPFRYRSALTTNQVE